MNNDLKKKKKLFFVFFGGSLFSVYSLQVMCFVLLWQMGLDLRAILNHKSTDCKLCAAVATERRPAFQSEEPLTTVVKKRRWSCLKHILRIAHRLVIGSELDPPEQT